MGFCISSKTDLIYSSSSSIPLRSYDSSSRSSFFYLSLIFQSMLLIFSRTNWFTEAPYLFSLDILNYNNNIKIILGMSTLNLITLIIYYEKERILLICKVVEFTLIGEGLFGQKSIFGYFLGVKTIHVLQIVWPTQLRFPWRLNLLLLQHIPINVLEERLFFNFIGSIVSKSKISLTRIIKILIYLYLQQSINYLNGLIREGFWDLVVTLIINDEDERKIHGQFYEILFLQYYL